jgi:hypothetical protein
MVHEHVVHEHVVHEHAVVVVVHVDVLVTMVMQLYKTRFLPHGLPMRKARHHAESQCEFTGRGAAYMAYAKTLDCLCGNLYFFVDFIGAKAHTLSC